MIADNSDKFRSILEDAGYTLREDGDFWRTKAVYREGDNATSLRIRKKDGYWKDFVTGAYGGFYDLIKKTNPNVKIEKGEIESAYPVESKEKVSFTRIYPAEMLNRLEKNYAFWVNRNIKPEIVEEFNGGVCKTGRMMGRFVFPIYDISQNIVGFSGRALYKEPQIKWKHIGNKTEWEYPLFKSQKDIQEKGYIILIESIGDMLSLWNAGIRNTAVTFGLTGLTKLMYKILGGTQKVVISFNDDSAKNSAGNKKAFFFRNQLISTGLISPSSVFVEKPIKNDFGDMTEWENKEWLKKLEEKIQNYE